MGFRDIVSAAKNNTPQRNTPVSASVIEQAEQITSVDTSNTAIISIKRDISYKDSEIKGFVPQARSLSNRSSSDPKHGSIIRNISQASDKNAQTGDQNIPWQECGYRKENMGRDYCTEYHCFCYKDKCRSKKIRK